MFFFFPFNSELRGSQNLPRFGPIRLELVGKLSHVGVKYPPFLSFVEVPELRVRDSHTLFELHIVVKRQKYVKTVSVHENGVFLPISGLQGATIQKHRE